jgi:hypothetical protein
VDDAERAIEIALAASHGDGYGTADVSPSGIDRSQLRRNLRLTPQERLEQMAHAVRILQPFQGILRRTPR